MKIEIIGSSYFCGEMVRFRNKLRALGRECELHEHYVARAAGKLPKLWEKMQKEHAKVKIEHDYIRYHYNEILNSDAVLVLNFDKNGVKNYIGGNTLMEMDQAYVNDKKIFLLNSVPQTQYREEIEALEPIIINNDLSKIN